MARGGNNIVIRVEWRSLYRLEDWKGEVTSRCEVEIRLGLQKRKKARHYSL